VDDLIAIIVSSILTALSMPGMLWGGLVWFALVPLFYELNRSRLVGGTLKVFVYSYIYLLLSHFWVFPVLSKNVPEVLDTFPPFVGVVTFFLMGVIMAAPLTGFGLVYMLLKNRFNSSPFLSSAVVASIFVVFEWLRSLGPLGFTGGRLSHALVNELGLLQLLSFGGTLLLVFVIVCVNHLAFMLLPRSLTRKALLVLIILGTVFSTNSLIERAIPRVKEDSGQVAEVSVIQTNFPQSLKYNEPASAILSVVEEALNSLPEGSWVLMPEATFMSDIRGNHVGSRLQEIVSERELSVLIGFPTYNENNYNQLRVITSEGFGDEFYAKIRLTPFVEILPYPRVFGLFGFLRFLDFFSPGKEYTVFDFAGTDLAAQICFDSYYPEVARGLVDAGGKVIVTSTNDGWFDHSTALIQHFVQTQLRAVENRRFAIQVSNTGITGVIDPYGRPLKTLLTGAETDEPFLIDTLTFSPKEDRTFYSIYGEWVLFVCLGITGVFLIATFKKTRTDKHPDKVL